jgi:translation elongation factor EF-Ts
MAKKIIVKDQVTGTTIKATDVLWLYRNTGGNTMNQCKKALIKANGDLEIAKDILSPPHAHSRLPNRAKAAQALKESLKTHFRCGEHEEISATNVINNIQLLCINTIDDKSLGEIIRDIFE